MRVVFLVNIINHTLSPLEVLVEELHGIPVVVASPVLPVLDDAVERHSEFTVLSADLQQFLLRLIAFTTLVEAVGPEREHRCLAREVTQFADDSVCRSSEEEIIIYGITHLRLQSEAFGSIKFSGRVVIPVDSIAALALEDIGIVIQVRLHHQSFFPTLIHAPVLQEADAIEGFVGGQGPALAHPETALVWSLGNGGEGGRALADEHGAVRPGKRNLMRSGVNADGESR